MSVNAADRPQPNTADRPQPNTADRPQPNKDGVSAPYWEAAARGELLIQKCPTCGHRQFYPRALCTSCGGNPEWERASGRGTVHTFTIIRQNGAKPFRDEVPYVVAMIDLEEGVRMMTNVTDVDPESVTIGMPVEVWFSEPPVDGDGDGVALPFFRPAP